MPKNLRFRSSSLVTATMIGLTLVISAGAWARDGQDSAKAETETTQTTSKTSDVQNKVQDKAETETETEGKLDNQHLKVCQVHQQVIKDKMNHIVDRAIKQIAVFDTIATRVETFYTSSGKTVSNYDALVKAVNDAKTKAQTDLAAVKANDSFTCDGSNPKGVASAFQTTLKQEIADLKAYKTAVKNLIVAVKSAVGETDSTTKTTTTGGTQ